MLKDQRQASLLLVKEWRDERCDVYQTADRSTKREQNERKIYLKFEDERREKSD